MQVLFEIYTRFKKLCTMILFWGDWAIKTSASEIDESLSLSLSVCSASFKKKNIVSF